MKTLLLPDETVFKKGGGHYGVRLVAGRLYCTNRRLIFESQELIMRVDDFVVELNLTQLVAIRPIWTKVFDFIPLAPNSFEVVLCDGTTHSFVADGRDDWIELVERLRGGAT